MEEIKLTKACNYKNIHENFFKRLVEVENLHQKNKLIGGFNDKNVIEELASIYKSAVEYYHEISKEKENYFNEKLNNLLSNEKIIKLMEETNQEINIRPSFSFFREKKFKNIYKTHFRITMNKIESNSKNIERIFDIKTKNEENEENYEKGVKIINNNIDEQEINFRIRLLEKVKGFSNLSKNNSDNISNLNSSPSLKKSPKKSYLIISPRKFSLLSLENFVKDNNNDNKNNYNSNSNSHSNSKIQNFNKKNTFINFFIDRFLLWMFHKFTQKFQNVISKNVKKLFDENYMNKRDIFLEYEEEFATFYDFFDKKNNEYDISIHTIIKSLLIDRKEKIQLENIKLLEELRKIEQIGKIEKICEDRHFSAYIEDLKNNIITFLLNKK
jgi:hypothetical protein